MTLKKKILLIAILPLIAGCCFCYRDIWSALSNLKWVSVISIGIFFAGSVYAIIERTFIIGFVSLAAALVLPWVFRWIYFYWPWVRQVTGY